jgi:hypothetical protein
VSAAFSHLFNTEASNALSKRGIRLNDDFVFTEEHARMTLKMLHSKMYGAYAPQIKVIDGIVQFNDSQMEAALGLGYAMSDAHEIAEQVGKAGLSAFAARNPASVLNVSASEYVNGTGELIENLTSSWQDLGLSGMAAGVTYMGNTDHRWLLFSQPNSDYHEALRMFK